MRNPLQPPPFLVPTPGLSVCLESFRLAHPAVTNGVVVIRVLVRVHSDSIEGGLLGKASGYWAGSQPVAIGL